MLFLREYNIPVVFIVLICINLSQDGSQEVAGRQWVAELVRHLGDRVPQLSEDIIVDDRCSLSIGRRLREARRTGYPLIVVVGKPALESTPRFELIDNTRRLRGITGTAGVAALDQHNMDGGGLLLTHLQLLDTVRQLCSAMQ